MVKRILSIVLWAATGAALVALFIAAREHYLTSPVRAIILQPQNRSGFVVTRQLHDTIAQICRRRNIGTLDMIAIQEVLDANPWIENNASKVDLDGTLQVNYKEYEPRFRVFGKDGHSAYVTEDGDVVPSSRVFTPYVLIASGNFDLRSKATTYHLDTIAEDANLISALHWYKAIHDNAFIANCVGQLYCNGQNQFELTAKGVGARIIVGDTCDASDKLRRLEAFIKQRNGHPETCTFTSINLNYKNQIVCTKR